MKTAIMAALAVVVSAPLQAQWPISPAGGKTDLSAPAPRTKDGKPDLSGLWEPNGAKYAKNIAADLKAGEIPFRPEAEVLFKANSKSGSGSNCLPPGVPRIDAVPTPFKIVQTPELVTILYGTLDVYRQIFTDGRELPTDPDPNWLGYSVGKWQGDTLVVESTGFNGRIWLDDAGHPATEALHVTERFRRSDFGHMELQITIDDPKAYTKPWTVTEDPHLVADAELRESVCWRSK